MVLGHKSFTQMFSFSKILVAVGKNGPKLHKILRLVPNVLTAIQKFFLLYHHVPNAILYRTNWIPPLAQLLKVPTIFDQLISHF